MNRFASLAVLVPVLSLAAAGCAEDEEPIDDPVALQLDELRAMVEPYHDAAAAQEAGYIKAGDCVELPQGAMGIHFISLERVQQPMDAMSPPILMYLPDDDGLRLVGVEYMVPIIQDGAPYTGEAPPRPESIGAAPVLFDGHPFDGPMPGHEPGMPWHFDQHVWLFDDNPAGTFMAYHPELGCE